MKCNKCKSSNVQKYQVIHEQGTSNINLGSNTVGGGIGFGGGLRGGVGLGRTGTSGTSQTLLATKTQPPKDLRLYPVTFISFIVFLIFLWDETPFYYFYSSSIIGVLLCIWSFKRASEVHEMNYNDWLKKWYCNKCGNSFLGK